MDNIIIKLKAIYLPFILIGVAFIAGYSFLNWLLIIRFNMLSLNEEVVNIWLPLASGWIPVLIVLRPRLKILALKTKKSDLPGLYYFVSAIAIILPTIISQMFLVTATGKLTVLKIPGAINTEKLTKYYKLQHHFVDTNRMAVYNRFETTGKNNEHLDMYIDVACAIMDTIPADPYPFMKKVMLLKGKKALIIVNGTPLGDNQNLRSVNPADVSDVKVFMPDSAVAIYGQRAKEGALIITTKPDGAGLANFVVPPLPKTWLGVEFHKQIGSSLSNERKEEEFRQFALESGREFSVKRLDDFVYLDRLGNNDKHKGFTKALNKRYPNLSGAIIFEAVDEPFEARNGGKLGWIFKSYGIGAVIFLLMVIIPKIDKKEYALFLNPSLNKQPSFTKSLLEMASPKNSLFITLIIAGLNVLVFIIMVFAGLGFISFPGDELLNWGANYRPAVLDGQWWRLFTAIFLHGGLMHLLGNMYGLFFAALFVEPKIGKLRFAIVYVVCGVMASLASIWWHPASPGVGASGAIFGLYGVSIVLLLINRADLKANRGILILNLVFIGFNLLLGIFGNADNAAHIGGLVAGMLAGLVLYFILPPPPAPKPKRRYVRKKKVVAADEPAAPEA
nr:rhomboid family intramembrane serine protease [uncultured Mucilaginibacter sp.]